MRNTLCELDKDFYKGHKNQNAKKVSWDLKKFKMLAIKKTHLRKIKMQMQAMPGEIYLQSIAYLTCIQILK